MYYHTTNPGPSIEDFKLALAKAITIAREKNITQIAIAVHGKGNLDGVVSDAIGESAVKLLQKPGGTIQFEEITIFLITEKIKSGLSSGIIVATHASTKYLKKLIQDYRVTDMVYVPWSPDELSEFVKNHKSEPIN